MRIFPSQLEIGENEGFDSQKDIFGYHEYGERMLKLVEAVEDPMVIAFDGPWGSGKSTFIKMWQGLLKNSGFPTIYFDAFANDYHDDVFSTLMGEIVSLPNTHASPTFQETKDAFVTKGVSIAKKLLPFAANIAVKVVTLNAIDSTDIDEIKKIGADISDGLSEVTEKAIRERIEARDAEKQGINDFKDKLKELVQGFNHLSGSGKNEKPLIFIIDELDRCKPSFAINVLEIVKHFFSVSSVHFVIVTNLKQLCKSVECVYGTSEPELYLQKFYNIHIDIENFKTDYDDNIRRTYIKYVFSSLDIKKEDPKLQTSYKEFFTEFSNAKKCSLRTIEKMITCAAITLSTDRKLLKVQTLLPALCAMKICDPEKYRAAKNGTLTADEVKIFLEAPTTQKEEMGEIIDAAELFKEFIIEGYAGPHHGWAASMRVQYQLRPSQVIPYMCDIIELFSFSGSQE